jgi:hypothetical protein
MPSCSGKIPINIPLYKIITMAASIIERRLRRNIPFQKIKDTSPYTIPLAPICDTGRANNHTEMPVKKYTIQNARIATLR